jgi:hypothetical protein
VVASEAIQIAFTGVPDASAPTLKAPAEQVSPLLPLSDPGTDVLVRVSPFVCQGFCGPSSALMIDDLTLE